MSLVRRNNILVPVTTLIVQRFPSADGAQPKAGDRFIVNGAPFNGTGIGLSLPQLAHYNPNPAPGIGNVVPPVNPTDPYPPPPTHPDPLLVVEAEIHARWLSSIAGKDLDIPLG